MIPKGQESITAKRVAIRAGRCWSFALPKTPEYGLRVNMTITMLYGFVPGALWGFVVMPWYGWAALAG
jgi:hypothetical protein